MKTAYRLLAIIGMGLLLAACKKEPAEYTVMGFVSPEEAGAVTPLQRTVTAGAAVTFSATPTAYWEFSHWDGDWKGTENPCTVTVNGNMKVTAVFTQKQYPVHVDSYGKGSVSQEVISTKADTYPLGSVVRLSAKPETGWTFDRWIGLSDEKNPVCDVTVGVNTKVQAVFMEDNGGYVPVLAKGVNVTGWFQYVNSISEVVFSSFYRKEFENIKSLGVSTIRLPIDFYALSGSAPDYTIPDALFVMLDNLVGWADELDLNLILDNHSSTVSDGSAELARTYLTKLWTQLANRYKSVGNHLLYEILNEPNGPSLNANWYEIQAEVVNAIRSCDQRHFIVVGAPKYNTYTILDELPQYSDSRLVYTFHFYDPFLFTHQGANWANMELITQGIPFPYDASRMPEGYDNYDYANQGTVQAVHHNLDYAVRFLQARNVPLFCGEFGVYNVYAKPEDRVYWHQVVREYLEFKGIAWALWTYNQGSFSLFKAHSDEIFEHDLDPDMIQALGMNMPPQTPLEILPDTQPLVLYDDYLSGDLMAQSQSGCVLDYYCTETPYKGTYCLKYTLGSQYTTLSWVFRPVRDFSWLKDNGYALTCRVKMAKAVQLQYRFMNASTHTGFPWRLVYDVPASEVTADGQWHTLTIPLSRFSDVGGWDVEWRNGCGLADWTRLFYFQISNEKTGQDGAEVYYDEIAITK